MLKFRKSIKIAKGVRINVSNKGVNSVSVGGKGATLNVGKRGTRATVGVPGSGLSYSKKLSSKRKEKTTNAVEQKLAHYFRPVGVMLGIVIFLFPILFYWLLLRKGYSTFSRIIWGCWLVVWFIAFVVN